MFNVFSETPPKSTSYGQRDCLPNKEDSKPFSLDQSRGIIPNPRSHPSTWLLVGFYIMDKHDHH